MPTDNTNPDVIYWLREIETKGLDAVSSVLVSKLGTPEAEAIQMAMVEHHKSTGTNRANPTGVDSADTGHPSEVSARTSTRNAFIVACIALGVAIIALVLSVLSVFK